MTSHHQDATRPLSTCVQRGPPSSKCPASSHLDISPGGPGGIGCAGVTTAPDISERDGGGRGIGFAPDSLSGRLERSAAVGHHWTGEAGCELDVDWRCVRCELEGC